MTKYREVPALKVGNRVFRVGDKAVKTRGWNDVVIITAIDARMVHLRDGKGKDFRFSHEKFAFHNK